MEQRRVDHSHMGCSSSAPKAPPPPPVETPHHRLQKRRKNSIHQLDTTEKEAVTKMFDEYRKTAARVSEADGATGGFKELTGPSERHSNAGPQKHKLMKKEGLRKILPSIDEKVFDFMWRLFDKDGTGFVDMDEFMMTMALLTSGIADSIEAQLEAIFCMFDSSHSETMSMEDFETMISTTVNLQLDHLLDSSHGATAFEAQLKKEYSEENLAFYQEVRAYKNLESASDRFAKVDALKQEFIVDMAPRQVNLPSTIFKALNESMGKCTAEDSPSDIFDAAAAEIFRLMEKDTFSRFKSDPDALAHLVEGYYKEAGVAHGEPIPFRTFHAWALKEPAVLVFFGGLCDAVQNIMGEYKASVGAQPAVQDV